MTFGKFMVNSIILKYPFVQKFTFLHSDMVFLYLHRKRGQDGKPKGPYKVRVLSQSN